MSKFGYLRGRGWTAIEVAIWLIALIVMITVAILFAAGAVGSWALLVGIGIVAVVALLRYRAEAEQKKRSSDLHGE